jgi:hypothetical protein
LRWLNNVSGVDLVQVSLLLIGQQDLAHFFRCRPLLPIGWRIVQIFCQRQKKPTNTAPTTLSAIQERQGNPLLLKNNYTLLVVSGNDKKNKRKLVLTDRNTVFALYTNH